MWRRDWPGLVGLRGRCRVTGAEAVSMQPAAPHADADAAAAQLRDTYSLSTSAQSGAQSGAAPTEPTRDAEVPHFARPSQDLAATPRSVSQRQRDGTLASPRHKRHSTEWARDEAGQASPSTPRRRSIEQCHAGGAVPPLPGQASHTHASAEELMKLRGELAAAAKEFAAESSAPSTKRAPATAAHGGRGGEHGRVDGVEGAGSKNAGSGSGASARRSADGRAGSGRPRVACADDRVSALGAVSEL